MIDRAAHDAKVFILKGASYRLKGRGLEGLTSVRTQIEGILD